MSRAAAAAPARQRGEAPRTERRFAVLDKAALARRRQRRRAGALLAAAGIVLAGSLGAVAAAQSVVTSQQVHLDVARQQLAAAVATEQQLQSTRARLAAPARVLALAERDLHMVSPGQVTYLAPVSEGRTLGRTVASRSSGSLRLAAPSRQRSTATSR